MAETFHRMDLVDADTMGTRRFRCPVCGAEIVLDKGGSGQVIQPGDINVTHILTDPYVSPGAEVQISKYRDFFSSLWGAAEDRAWSDLPGKVKKSTNPQLIDEEDQRLRVFREKFGEYLK